MTLELDKVIFENDFFHLNLPNGGQLVMNNIEEAIKVSAEKAVSVERINMQIWYNKNEETFYSDCSSVIGFTDSITKITTEYKEYEGKILTKENMRFCKVEIYE